MVLVNPGISGYDWSALDAYFAKVRAAVDADDLAGFVEVQLRMWFDGPERGPNDVDRAVRDEVRHVLTEQTERNPTRGTPPRLRELRAAAHLAEIRIPTLIVESALDVPDIRAICALLQRNIIGARRVVIDRAAHLVNLERPAEFAAAVLPFLAGR